jgi:hypothetical protein
MTRCNLLRLLCPWPIAVSRNCVVLCCFCNSLVANSDSTLASSAAGYRHRANGPPVGTALTSWRAERASLKAGGRPSTAFLTVSGKDVDGEPSPAMTGAASISQPIGPIVSVAGGGPDRGRDGLFRGGRLGGRGLGGGRGDRARALGDACPFAGAAAQVIQLGPPHVAAAHHGDLGDQRRV